MSIFLKFFSCILAKSGILLFRGRGIPVIEVDGLILSLAFVTEPGVPTRLARNVTDFFVFVAFNGVAAFPAAPDDFLFDDAGEADFWIVVLGVDGFEFTLAVGVP